MRFTIFTSFYNYLDTFDNLVDSVFKQIHYDWEWIVSDDFSENPEVSRKLNELCFKHPDKVRRIDPSFKKEFYWNPPVSASNADIFMVFDSDDIMFPALLSVYDHHFWKFPEVVLISSNSLILNDSAVSGSLRSARHIHYGKNCNSYQSYMDKSYEYNWGDARAWRRGAVETFSEPGEWKFCAEDALKITVCEEIGKILYLPRVLCSYAYREDSISHAKQTDYSLFEETPLMFQKAHQRLDRDRLCSIDDHYDRALPQTTAFYLSSLNKSIGERIEFFSPSATARDKDLIEELYYDHRIETTEELEHFPAYLIANVISEEEIKMLADRLDRGVPSTQLLIQAPKGFEKEVNELLSSRGWGWNWHTYTHYTAIINF